MIEVSAAQQQRTSAKRMDSPQQWALIQQNIWWLPYHSKRDAAQVKWPVGFKFGRVHMRWDPQLPEADLKVPNVWPNCTNSAHPHFEKNCVLC
jgi:hypothetical protein